MRPLIILFVGICPYIHAQVYKEEKSKVTFFSDALIEDITATNTKSKALLDVVKGEVAFEVPIIEFQFAKDLMKQHFNEKYMETETYPKATFGGKLESYDGSKPGVQQVTAQGKLTIHGITKTVQIPGTIELLDNNKATIKAKFMVRLKDYKVKIPSVVFQNIAEEVEVTVEFALKSK